MIYQGDCRTVLKTLADTSVQCVVTSPPYFGLRDYGVARQIGLELTPDAFVAELVEVFREVRRVLADDGTVWLNLGDSYNAHPNHRSNDDVAGWKQATNIGSRSTPSRSVDGLKAKDLIGIPWRVAFALQADGWYLRSDIIWSKPNPMPESVQDRPTKAHEYIFLLTKSARYYYNAAAIREPYAESTLTQFEQPYEGEATKDYAAVGVQNPSAIKKRITDKQRGHGRRHAGFNDRWDASVGEYTGKHGEADAQSAGRRMLKNVKEARDAGAPHDNPFGGANKRSVWTVATQPFPGAHFATFPEALIEPCILAGSRQGDTVLDPFAGAGTVGVVCAKAQRQFIGIELNPAYVAMANARIADVAPLFAEAVERTAVSG